MAKPTMATDPLLRFSMATARSYGSWPSDCAYDPSRFPSAGLSSTARALAMSTLSQPPISATLSSAYCLMRGEMDAESRRARNGAVPPSLLHVGKRFERPVWYAIYG